MLIIFLQKLPLVESCQGDGLTGNINTDDGELVYIKLCIRKDMSQQQWNTAATSAEIKDSELSGKIVCLSAPQPINKMRYGRCCLLS